MTRSAWVKISISYLAGPELSRIEALVRRIITPYMMVQVITMPCQLQSERFALPIQQLPSLDPFARRAILVCHPAWVHGSFLPHRAWPHVLPSSTSSSRKVLIM